MQTEKIEENIEYIVGIAKCTVSFFNGVWITPYGKGMILALIAIVALLFIVRSIRKHFAPIKLFNNSAGYVTITPKALNELVQSVCYSMGALNRPTIKAKVRRGRLSLLITLKMVMGQRLSDVSSEIQEELINALREHLGVEKLGRIDVRIKGFRGILKKPSIPMSAFKPIEDIEKEDNPADANNPFSPDRNK